MPRRNPPQNNTNNTRKNNGSYALRRIYMAMYDIDGRMTQLDGAGRFQILPDSHIELAALVTI